MAYIQKVRGHEPVIGENTFVAETAVIVGDVTVGRDCSIWFNAVLRGDVNKIVIGDRTNIQDGVVLHTIYDQAKHPSQTIIGNDVSVGHNAIVHGAVIGDNCLIGMGRHDSRQRRGALGLHHRRQRPGALERPTRTRLGLCRRAGQKGQGGYARAARRDHSAHGARLHALRLVA